MQNIFIDVLPPWVETGLQPAFYDLESGTVLQQTARMYARVRELNEAFNTFSENVTNEVNQFEQDTNDEIERFEKSVNDTVDEYIEKFNDLHDYVEDYFANLDVQEEINNKLDQMLEDGVLQEIIADYIQSNVAWTFDTVADMKAATNLIDGSYARTLGYYSADDGGGAVYIVKTTQPATYYETNGTLYYQLVEDNSINFEMFGAYGDGTHDDTTAITNAFASGTKIISEENKTYLISGNITCAKNIYLDLSGSTIKSTSGYTIQIGSLVSNVNISNGVFDDVAIVDDGTGTVAADYNISGISMKDTEVDGIRLDNAGTVYISNSKFYNIGKGTININYQGCAIRINYADYANVENCSFEYAHGTGACVIRNTDVLYIKNNYFDNNDYRGIATADDGADSVMRGSIENNIIKNCGVNASHNTGVGCNGIYSNNYGNIKNIVIRGNHITNVCENGIEGAYGLVEYNYVDGTGVDQTNHPTPSASGINMYGNVYRYNVVKNSYLAGMYVSGNTHSESTNLADKQIYGNTIGKSVHEPNRAIYVNGTTYTNIDIHDNVMDGYIETAPAAVYTKCRIGNNYNYQGKAYKNNFASYISDKGAIGYAGFSISGTTISNITTAGVTYTIDSDNSVTFTSTGSNKAFSISQNVNKQTIQCCTLLVGDSTTAIKVTVQGVKDDDTTVTIANNRSVKVNGGIAGITTQLDNTYKTLKYIIYVEDNGTLKLNNIQTKEITI